jgi:hypothetical protein
MKKVFTLLIVLLFAATSMWAQSTYTFPGNTLSGSLGGWGGKGYFYNPIFNVDAAGGIDITYYDIDVSQFTEANVWTTKGVAIPGVSKSNSMTSIDPNNNSIWCNILNMEIASGTDYDGHSISTLGPDGISGTSDDTRHQGTQDWYRGITGGKIDGPAAGPYYNNESYVIPNPRHPSATPTSASELNKYDFRLRILPTGYHAYTYEMWFRMHKSAAQIEGAYWVYNIAINNSDDAWKKFAQGATDVFPVSNIDLSAVYVFMGLGNFQDPATQSLTWGDVVVTGTHSRATTIGTPTSSVCGTLDVPVTVQDFNNIGAISLKLNYDATKLQLLPIVAPPFAGVTLNPTISAAAVSGNDITGQFSMAHFLSDPSAAITLADDAVLFTLHFNVLPAAVGGSTTNLTWSTVSQECEYAGPGGTPVYVSTFNNGAVTIPSRPVKNTTTGMEYCTIKAAIDDPATNNLPDDRDVITVAAGTYTEDIIVNKSLTILGPNADASGCSTRVAEAIVVPKTNAVGSGEIFHVTASNVTIKGFTIDGDNTLLTSGVTNTTGADMNAAEGVTIYVDNVNNLTVSNNIFQNLSYFGVSIYGASFSAPATSGHIISYNKFQNLACIKYQFLGWWRFVI